MISSNDRRQHGGWSLRAVLLPAVNGVALCCVLRCLMMVARRRRAASTSDQRQRVTSRRCKSDKSGYNSSSSSSSSNRAAATRTKIDHVTRRPAQRPTERVPCADLYVVLQPSSHN